MPMDMRDAIAHYLAYTGGQMPQGGFPGMMQPPGPRPGTPDADFTGSPPAPLPGPPGPNVPDRGPWSPMPSVPSNLQGYERLPSGQFLPGAPPIGQGGGNWPAGPGGGNWPMPPQPPDQGMPDDTIPPGVPQTPPVNTPMQAPYGGQTVAGMDPDQWLRMYRGGAGA